MRSKSASLPAEPVDTLAPQSLRGTRVGNFVVARQLGAGGMAVVYEAHHPALGRKVAIKLLKRSLSESAPTRARFLQEARLLAGLQHPNIVKVFDLGEVAERAYYVMELLVGTTLAELLTQRGRLPPQEAGTLLAQVAAGLSAAHRQEIVHRDLKPENVFVVAGTHPCCKLMDFGIAKAETAEASLRAVTQAGQILGTPTHLAPEQALGQAARIGPRTDLYALGVMAFELLSGTLPFAADSAVELMIQHVRDPPPKLAARMPGLPAALCDLIDQCLAKNPSHRPASATAFAKALAEALRTKVIQRITPAPPSAPAPALTDASSEHPAPSQAQTPEGSSAEPEGATSAPTKASQPPLTSPPPSATRKALAGRGGDPAEPLRERRRTPASRRRATARDGADPSNTLDRLLQRIQKRPDFPSFLANVSEISRKADADSAFCAGDLGEAILKDLALTAKLIRMVNTLFANRFSGGVHSVKHAVVILGFDRVRTIAMSASVLKLPPTPRAQKRGKTRAAGGTTRNPQALIDSTVSSLVSGELAQLLAPQAGIDDVELAMMCAMFHNLGKQLVIQYLPDDYSDIERLVGTGLTERQATLRALGTSFHKLSFGVAERWNLPLVLQQVMSHEPDLEQPPASQKERLSTLSQLANELCEAVMQGNGSGGTDCLEPVLRRYRRLLSIDKEELGAILGTICKSFEQHYRASLGPYSRRNPFLQNARSLRGDPEPSEAPERPGPPRPEELAEVQTLSEKLENSIQQRTDPKTAIKECLEFIRVFLATPRVLLLREEPQSKALIVAAGAGPDAEGLTERFRVPAGSNLLSTILRAGRSERIDDALAPHVMRNMPRAYYEAIGAEALALYSCTARGYPSGLLLLDCDDAQKLPNRERAVAIKALRGLLPRLIERLDRPA